MSDAVTLHGSCVAMGAAGVLLLGPPGAGKSDLALRLIDEGARLVADDQVRIARSGDGLAASAPAALSGLIEVRGLGIISLPPLPEARLALAVQLQKATDIERLPEPERHEILGVRLRLIRIDPWFGSAPARLRAALRDAAVAGNVRRFAGGGQEKMTDVKRAK